MKTKILDGKYIACVLSGQNVRGIAITDEEYEEIQAIASACPVAEDGFYYRLTTSMEWELVEMPAEETDPEATEDDYQTALREMGVNV